jgi:MOSC domain-containing protein YiiM
MSSEAPVLVSVNVGMPKDVSWQGRTVHTGVWKDPVSGPRMVRRLNIDGDGQGDTAGHGGEQRAVFVYQIGSYRHWQRHFGRDDLPYGWFGENLTVDGLPDDEVCIGDRYRIGEAEFEVTQPRVTCYRVGLRTGEHELPALLVSHHRPGFYMRVVREGRIEAGDEIVKTRPGPHALTVADTDALLYLPGRDPAKLRVATRIPALSPGWQESFRELLAGPTAPDDGPAWTGFRPLRVTRVVDLPDLAGRRCVAGRPSRPVPDAPHPRPRPARPGAQLLPVVGAGRRHLPDQRQARAARERQRLPHRRPAARRGPRRGGAPRRIRPRSRDRTGPAHLRRHRRHSASLHAARACSGRQRPRGLVDPR